MSYTNETMPEVSPTIQIPQLRYMEMELHARFWHDKYSLVVNKMENMISACNDHGCVELTFGSKKYRFTMTEIN